jgi:hypothetical protein
VSAFLLGGGQRVDVVEDVGGFGYAEGGAHFGEHVVLGFAWGMLDWVSRLWLDLGMELGRMRFVVRGMGRGDVGLWDTYVFLL